MSSQIITDYEKAMLRTDIPDFKPGDRLRVSLRIVEGDKERLQDFEGDCIRRKGSGITETVTLRKVNYGVGIERIIPLHSPRVDKIKVVRYGRVRRAKLYYIRDLRGKAARIKERNMWGVGAEGKKKGKATTAKQEKPAEQPIPTEQSLPTEQPVQQDTTTQE